LIINKNQPIPPPPLLLLLFDPAARRPFPPDPDPPGELEVPEEPVERTAEEVEMETML